METHSNKIYLTNWEENKKLTILRAEIHLKELFIILLNVLGTIPTVIELVEVIRLKKKKKEPQRFVGVKSRLVTKTRSCNVKQLKILDTVITYVQ